MRIETIREKIETRGCALRPYRDLQHLKKSRRDGTRREFSSRLAEKWDETVHFKPLNGQILGPKWLKLANFGLFILLRHFWGLKKVNSNIALFARWVETTFCRDETRRENSDAHRDNSRKNRDFKISRRDGTRRRFSSRLAEKFLVSDFSTHPYNISGSFNLK